MSINRLDMTALTWKQIPWYDLEKYVFRFQRRIYNASLQGDRDKIYWLQKRLLLTPHAKLLAVRHATQFNAERATPEVDCYVTMTQRLEIARTLQIDGKAESIRRVIAPKPGTSVQRPLGILVIHDRAKQALVKLVLEPEWEARFESNSYGFRPGRGGHDGIEALFTALAGKPKWVLRADIASCFNSIDDQALLAKIGTFPALHRQIKSWLQADIMVNFQDRHKSVEPWWTGTSQDDVISPLLANIALHGLENEVNSRFTKTSPRKMEASCIRYGDNFVILHTDQVTIGEVMTFVIEWLAPMGFSLSLTKTIICSSHEGFEFLGCHFIHVQQNGTIRTKIVPSKKSQEKLLTQIRKALQSRKSAATHEVINSLNPIIIRWGNYFSRVECKQTFSKLDYLVYTKILKWAYRRHPRWSKTTTMAKYFPKGQTYFFRGKVHHDNWVLTDSYKDHSETHRTIYLKRLQWIPSTNHMKVSGTRTPYDGDSNYWSLRLRRYVLLNTRELFLLKRQKGRCEMCGNSFVAGQQHRIGHVIPLALGGKDVYSNLRIVHLKCPRDKSTEDGDLISKKKSEKKTRGAV